MLMLAPHINLVPERSLTAQVVTKTPEQLLLQIVTSADLAAPYLSLPADQFPEIAEGETVQLFVSTQKDLEQLREQVARQVLQTVLNN